MGPEKIGSWLCPWYAFVPQETYHIRLSSTICPEMRGKIVTLMEQRT